MKHFKTILKTEINQFSTKQNILVLLTFSFLLLWVLSLGEIDYKSSFQYTKTFQETEIKKALSHNTYTQYGAYGVRIISMPNPFFIISNNSSNYSNLTAMFDSGSRLNIYSDFKGNSIFSLNNFIDYSGVLMIVGSMLSMIYGISIYRNKSYLKFLSSIIGFKQIFFFKLVSGVLVIFLFLSFQLFIMIIWAIFNNIHIISSQLPIYYILLYLFFCLTFIIGIIICTIANQKNQNSISVIVYSLIIFIIPSGINKFAHSDINNIISIQNENYGLNELMTFEKRFKENMNINKSIKPLTIVRGGQNLEYKKIKHSENVVLMRINKSVSKYFFVSSLFPSSFLQSFSRELGGNGLRNFIDFYNYAHIEKYTFIDYYIKKKFQDESKVVKPYKNEYIYFGKNQSPLFVFLGFAICLIYLLFLIFLSFYCYRNYFFYQMKKLAIENLSDFKIQENKTTFIATPNGLIKDQIINLFFGKSSYTPFSCQEFIFVPDSIPQNIIVKDFLSLSESEITSRLNNKRFSCLSDEEYNEIILNFLHSRNCGLVLFDDFIKKGINASMTQFFLQRKQSSDMTIVYCSTSVFPLMWIQPDIKESIICHDGKFKFRNNPNIIKIN